VKRHAKKYNQLIVRTITAGKLITLHSFTLDDGADSEGLLIQASDGNLYGTTYSGGGSYNDGTIFKITPKGKLTTLHTFKGLDGGLPVAGPIQGTNGTFGNNLKGTSRVVFNGTAAHFKVVSGSEIRTIVTTGATTGTVEVTTPNGTLKSNVVFRVIK
jgi:uncharacterized repeat protein (TIGR03803 family)